MPPTREELSRALQELREAKNAVLDEVARAVIGQETTLRLLCAAILARGHALLVGVPGLAKTLIVKTLASTLELSFKRIQFTPDLMPTDITGTDILVEHSPGAREFRFVKGPVFANVILADEINRTPPKTQAALLEAMQERQITVGQASYALPELFTVIATQNPIEQEGTYELPEAQLDRFMLELDVVYPSLKEEEKILTLSDEPALAPRRVLSAAKLLDLQRLIRMVAVSNYLVSYMVRLIRATRPEGEFAPPLVKEYVDWGVSPRAGQNLVLAAKSLAAMEGRINIALEDVKEAAIPVLRHRLGLNFKARADGVSAAELLRRLLATLPEPRSAGHE